MFQETSALSGLQKPDDYQARNSHLFPSKQSFAWYLRQHRPRLVAARALLHIAGRLWIDPPKFDSCVLEAGAKDRHQEVA